MTDVTEPVQPIEAPVENTVVEPTEPQIPPTIEQMRHAMHVTLQEAYGILMNVVGKIPMHPQLKCNAITRFDEGLLWTKEAINLVKMPEPAPEATPPVSDENPVVDSEQNPVVQH